MGGGRGEGGSRAAWRCATAVLALLVLTPTARAAEPAWGALRLLGGEVAAGSRVTLRWQAGQSFSGAPLRTPVIVVRGAAPGPALCLTAAVHGDELNGVEIIRRVLAKLDPAQLRGTVIGVPIVNLLAFAEGSRYLPDRSDLNRFFPGHPRLNTAQRMAHGFFQEVVQHCERLVDIHTGSFKRENLPQLRANLDIEAVREFVTHFGATAVLHNARERGTLRDAASAAGIPAVTLELGQPGTVQREHVRYGVKAIDTLLDKLGMIDRLHVWQERQPIFFRARWLRAAHGGILSSDLRLGAAVAEGELLGYIVNPLSSERSEIRAPFAGRLLGRALDQFVLPGFAVFHVGIEDPGAAGRGPLPESSEGDDEQPMAGDSPDAGARALLEPVTPEAGDAPR